VIRQRRRDLTVIRLTPDVIFDQLIGAGCVRKLVFSWGGKPWCRVAAPLPPTPWSTTGRLRSSSRSTATRDGQRFARRASNLPFAVLRGYVGTDLLERTPSVKPIECPFTGEQLTAVEALNPDVGVIPAQRADRDGKRAAVGDRRRAEGDRAGVRAFASSPSRRSSTSSSRCQAPSCCRTGP